MAHEPRDAGDRVDRPRLADAPRWLELKFTLAGGAVVAATLFLTVLFVGAAGSAEARALLEFAMPSVRFLCSSVLTMGATVMLHRTVLGLSYAVAPGSDTSELVHPPE